MSDDVEVLINTFEIIKTSQLPEIEDPSIPETEEEMMDYTPRDYREKSFEDKLCEFYDSYGIQFDPEWHVLRGTGP